MSNRILTAFHSQEDTTRVVWNAACMGDISMRYVWHCRLPSALEGAEGFWIRDSRVKSNFQKKMEARGHFGRPLWVGAANKKGLVEAQTCYIYYDWSKLVTTTPAGNARNGSGLYCRPLIGFCGESHYSPSFLDASQDNHTFHIRLTCSNTKNVGCWQFHKKDTFLPLLCVTLARMCNNTVVWMQIVFEMNAEAWFCMWFVVAELFLCHHHLSHQRWAFSESGPFGFQFSGSSNWFHSSYHDNSGHCRSPLSDPRLRQKNVFQKWPAGSLSFLPLNDSRNFKSE